ncbi:hypothetical protein [Actinomycetospora aeridis]|uniref:Uncharacterized protein n=1 Tax=Actinomycetospora aeridis TaxID=3129231 RepID=A0ABU8NCM5_9PSEU
MTDDEVLVVLADTADFDEAVEELRRRATVLHLMPPRLAVVRLRPGVPLEALGVAGSQVYRGAPPTSVLADLTEAEQGFAQGWTAPPKQRRGDQLSWDASGFEPPDPR